MRRSLICWLAVQALAASSVLSSPIQARGQAGERRGAWFKDSRFAMFVHWGPYSRLAGRWEGRNYYGISEWIMNRARIPVAEYEKVAAAFYPNGLNALEWLRLAKSAGMRHVCCPYVLRGHRNSPDAAMATLAEAGRMHRIVGRAAQFGALGFPHD